MIHATQSGGDVRAITNYTFDLECGFGASNDFELKSTDKFSLGDFVYIDGTEYGGIIDRIKYNTETDIITYSGRTWHGILDSRQSLDGVVAYNDANALLRSVVNAIGLTDVFRVSSDPMPRSIAYRGKKTTGYYTLLAAALKNSGLKIKFRRQGGITSVWVEDVSTIHGEADSDLIAFTYETRSDVPNHLFVYNRDTNAAIKHLYTDGAGNIRDTQVLTGASENIIYMPYQGMQSGEFEGKYTQDLNQAAYQEMRKAQVPGKVEITSVSNESDWDIGDVLVGVDQNTGVTVSAKIAKKVVKVGESGALKIDFDTE